MEEREDEIRAMIQAAVEEFHANVTPEDKDFMTTYKMEQGEAAKELYESAVEDGVDFAVMQTNAHGEEEVYVNTKWLAMIIKTVAEATVFSGDMDPRAIRISEILGQTVLAADLFVGK